MRIIHAADVTYSAKKQGRGKVGCGSSMLRISSNVWCEHELDYIMRVIYFVDVIL